MKPYRTHWNLTGLLVWIMHRDRIFADLEDETLDSAIDTYATYSNFLTGLDCIMFFEQAEDEALRALISGKLKAFGSLNPGGSRVPIPKEGWVGRSFDFRPDIAIEKLATGFSLSRYENLLFPADEAFVIWPPRSTLPSMNKKPQSKSDKGKAQTQSKYEKWRRRAKVLRKQFPGQSGEWYARKIAREDIAEGASVSYIRKQIGGAAKKL